MFLRKDYDELIEAILQNGLRNLTLDKGRHEKVCAFVEKMLLWKDPSKKPKKNVIVFTAEESERNRRARHDIATRSFREMMAGIGDRWLIMMPSIVAFRNKSTKPTKSGITRFRNILQEEVRLRKREMIADEVHHRLVSGLNGIRDRNVSIWDAVNAYLSDNPVLQVRDDLENVDSDLEPHVAILRKRVETQKLWMQFAHDKYWLVEAVKKLPCYTAGNPEDTDRVRNYCQEQMEKYDRTDCYCGKCGFYRIKRTTYQEILSHVQNVHNHTRDDIKW